MDGSTMARIAGADVGIGLDELALAARNHGLPLEALRYDLTPIVRAVLQPIRDRVLEAVERVSDGGDPDQAEGLDDPAGAPGLHVTATISRARHA